MAILKKKVKAYGYSQTEATHMPPLVLQAWKTSLNNSTLTELRDLTFQGGEDTPVFQNEELRNLWVKNYKGRGGTMSAEILNLLKKFMVAR